MVINNSADSSCTRISSEGKIHSAAAYLLFYRRRSEKPLGPQYLQDLVTEYRAPKDSSNEDDSDSGEGRLGGPTRSRHGSSSTLAGAGAGAMSRQGNNESGGAGPGNSLMAMNESLSWSFAAIEGGDGTHEPPDSSDAGSTAAQGSGEDTDSGRGGSAPPYQEAWTAGDGDWPAAEDNTSESAPLYDTEEDRVHEINLNASSSQHADTELF